MSEMAEGKQCSLYSRPLAYQLVAGKILELEDRLQLEHVWLQLMQDLHLASPHRLHLQRVSRFSRHGVFRCDILTRADRKSEETTGH
jgi:hypothetical protein